MLLWAAVFVVVAVASAAQVVSGFGFAMIGTPLLAVLVGPRAAVVGITIVGLLLVAQLTLRSKGQVERRVALIMTASALAGMPLGVLALARANERVLTAIIAVVVICFTILLWRGFRLPVGDVPDGFAGFLAGILSTSTGTSGPPIVISLSSRSLEPVRFRGTISAIFLLQGAAAITVFAVGGQVTTDAFRVALVGLPAVVLGSVAGEVVFQRLSAPTFHRIVLGMLLLSGIASLIAAAVAGS